MPRSVTACAGLLHSPTAPGPTIPVEVMVHRRIPLDVLRARLAPGQYRALSRISGISRQHISRVLRGRAVPSLPVAVKLAKAAGITVGMLQDHLDRVRNQGVGR